MGAYRLLQNLYLACIHESAAFLDFIAWGAPLISHVGKVAQQTRSLSGILSEGHHVESDLFMNKPGLLLRGWHMHR